MGERHLSLFLSLGLALLFGTAGCPSSANDARDVAVLGGEEIGLEAPEEVLRVMTQQGAALLACDPSLVTVDAHAYGNLSYWVASGCSASETLALARRCAPGTARGCAAKVVSISDGDPSPQLDPDMRAQSVDAIGMASLVTRGSVDLVCPPSQVLLDYATTPMPLTVLHGCGRHAEYVFANGGFQRVTLDALR